MNKRYPFKIYCVAPIEYWRLMEKKLLLLPWKVQYGNRSRALFEKIVIGIRQLEEKTWTIPTPSFVRSNFGFFGPGVILVVECEGKIVAELNFVGTFAAHKTIHIWDLIVGKDHRRKGFAKYLLVTALSGIKTYADNITLQTRTDSDALSLYLKLGTNKIIWVQSHDTGDWARPKIGLSIEMPHDPYVVFSTQNVQSEKIGKLFQVKSDDFIWRKIGKEVHLSGNYELVNCYEKQKNKILTLRKLKK